jgi:hypothetical protein
MRAEQLDHTYVLNFVAKYLARGASSDAYAEPWRFPLIDSCKPAGDTDSTQAFNLVTFVWRAAQAEDHRPVSVVGSFDKLWDSTPLERVQFYGQATVYLAVTVRIPIGEVHTYKFIVGGEAVLDPINPQRQRLNNGLEWSRFFTQYCTAPISLEEWEIAILARLTNEILPFTAGDAKQFMDRYYFNSDRAAQDTTFRQAFRLEQPVGAVNFIDNLLSRDEGHRLIDYKICLKQIDAVLRNRFPNIEPAQLPSGAYGDLYKEMASDHVDGWDTNKYQSPRFFLTLLRRHTYLGAFSHPKYGGNAGGAGWAYLRDQFQNQNGQPCFDWQRAIERPLGKSVDYFG